MPFDRPNAQTPQPALTGLMDLSRSDPDFFRETIPAAFRTENLIGSTFARQSAPRFETDDFGAPTRYLRDAGFDPLDESYLAGYEDHVDRFATILTRDQGEALRANIDRERADRETLDGSGVAGMAAMMAAGMLDPTVLIPVGGQVRKGASLLSNVSRFALAAGEGAAVAELGLHATQETRTLEESAFAIAGATFLGGVIGGVAHPFLKSTDGIAAAARVEDDMVMPREGEPDWADPMQALPDGEPMPAGHYSRGVDAGADVGAAARERPTLDEQAIEGVVARAIGNAVRLQDPVLRGITSRSLRHRELIEGLADIPAGLVKNEARYAIRTLPDGREQRYLVWGKRTEQSVESFIRRRDSHLGAAVTAADDAYARYLHGRDRKAGDILASGIRAVTRTLPDGKMSRPDFHDEVTRAMRRGDVHDIPEVEAAAQQLRREFFDPLKDEARDMGLFGYELRAAENPDDPPVLVPREPNVADTAQSWMPRVYNREKIEAERPAFTALIHEHFIAKRNEAARQAEALDRELAATREDAQNLLAEGRRVLAERGRVRREARSTIDKAERARQRAGAGQREAATQAADAGRRSEATDFDELSPLDAAYYRGLQADVARGHGTERPVTLTQFIRGLGGIRDVGGDLKAMDAHLRNLVNNKSGAPADDVALAASEAGYIGSRAPDGEIVRGSLNDLTEAIRDELAGRRVVSENLDGELIAYEDMLADLGDAVEQAGLDVRAMSVEDFASWMDGGSYRKATGWRRGKHVEALRREELTSRRLRAAQDKVEDAEFDLEDARLLARSLREGAPALTEQANELRKAFKAQRARARALAREHDLADYRAQKTDDELLEDARRTVDHVLGGASGRLSFDGPGARSRSSVTRRADAGGLSGRFKPRVLDIRDELLEPWLDDNLEHALRLTQRSMVPDMELIKRYGSVDLEVQLKEIAEDYDRLIAPADPGDVAGLSKKKQNALSDMEGVRDRLRGTYGLPADANGIPHRLARMAVSLNYLRLMGGVTISSLSDFPRAVMTHGIGNAFGPMVRALSGDLKAMRSMGQELMDAGPGFEMVLNNRAHAMADLMDDYGRHSKLERMVTAAQGHFGYASLIAPWNHAMKSISGFAVQNRVLRIIEDVAGGRVSRKDAAFLGRIGIGEDDARAMAREFARHGETENGQRLANSRAWANTELRERWLNAVRKEVDRLIVTPGLDKPLTASKDWGRVWLQFRSYNFAATQRVLIAYTQGLAARDAHAAMALATQIGMGMIVAKLKAEQYGISTDDWETERWLAEGFDRSGVMGVLTDVNMMAEHATRGRVGLSRLAGEGRLTRYGTRNAIGAWMGPSFGGAQDTLTGISGMLSGEGVRDSDVAALGRVLPYQNLFWLRDVFDGVEAATADAIGAEE